MARVFGGGTKDPGDGGRRTGEGRGLDEPLVFFDGDMEDCVFVVGERVVDLGGGDDGFGFRGRAFLRFKCIEGVQKYNGNLIF